MKMIYDATRENGAVAKTLANRKKFVVIASTLVLPSIAMGANYSTDNDEFLKHYAKNQGELAQNLLSSAVSEEFLTAGLLATNIQEQIKQSIGKNETLDSKFGTIDFSPAGAEEIKAPISSSTSYDSDKALIVKNSGYKGYLIGSSTPITEPVEINAGEHSLTVKGTLTQVQRYSNGLIVAKNNQVQNIDVKAGNIFLEHESNVVAAEKNTTVDLQAKNLLYIASRPVAEFSDRATTINNIGGNINLTSSEGSIGINAQSGSAIWSGAGSVTLNAADSIIVSVKNAVEMQGGVQATQNGKIELNAHSISMTMDNLASPFLYALNGDISLKASNIYLEQKAATIQTYDNSTVSIQGSDVTQIIGNIYADGATAVVNINTEENQNALTYIEGEIEAWEGSSININTQGTGNSRVVLNGEIVTSDYKGTSTVTVNFGSGGLFNGISRAEIGRSSGVSQFSFGENSVWYVKGNSQVSSLHLSSALIDLTSAQANNPTLNVDSLLSTNATLLLNATSSGQSQSNGSLKVANSASGNLYIHVASGGSFDGRNDSGILVETPTGQSLSLALAAPAFSTDGTNTPIIDLGVYNYELVTKDENGKTVTYLTPYISKEDPNPDPTPGTDPDPTPVPDPSTPTLSPSATAVLALAGTGSQTSQFLYSLSDLRKRMGDVRYGAADGLYAGIRGGKDRISGFASTSFKNEYGAVSIGYDRKVNDNWIVGVAFEAIEGDQTVKSNGYRADGEDSTQSLKAYATWFNDIGCYADLVIAANRFDQDLSTHMLDGTKVDGSYNSTGFGTSAEVGKKFSFGADDTWFIEPQAQLAYYRVQGEDFRLSNGMTVEQENADSLTGRLGVVAGRTFLNSDGTGYQLSMKAGVNHEFLGDEDILVNGERFSDNTLGTRGYYGVGLDWYVSDHMRLFGQIEREEGSHYTSEINARVGIKYHF